MFDQMNCNTCGKSQRPEAPAAYKCSCSIDDVINSFVSECNAGADGYVKSVERQQREAIRMAQRGPQYTYNGSTVSKNGNYTVDELTVEYVNLDEGDTIKNSRVLAPSIDLIGTPEYLPKRQWVLKVSAPEYVLDELSRLGAFVGTNFIGVLSKDTTGKDGGDKFPVVTEDTLGDPVDIKKGDTVSVVLNVYVRKDGTTVTELDKVTLLRRS